MYSNPGIADKKPGEISRKFLCAFRIQTTSSPISHRNFAEFLRAYPFQTPDIKAEVSRLGAELVMCVYATHTAKIMLCLASSPLVQSQLIRTFCHCK